MKPKHLLLLFGALFLSACGVGASDSAHPQSPTSLPGTVLIVTDGALEAIYTIEDLQALPSTQAAFNDVMYVGVPLVVLLDDAGFDPQNIKAVKAKATDGFSSNYDPALILKEDTIVAYQRVDGPLEGDEGKFRMVLPDQAGSLNARLLFKLEVIP